jgi:FeS assembly protein IscX
MFFGWTDIDDIALGLEEQHPGVDPLTVTFPALRKMVEGLPDFEADPEHPVNEQILEAIQGAWIEERQDAEGEGDDDKPSRTHNPFR